MSSDEAMRPSDNLSLLRKKLGSVRQTAVRQRCYLDENRAAGLAVQARWP
jgi:hypothetical protein